MHLFLSLVDWVLFHLCLLVFLFEFMCCLLLFSLPFASLSLQFLLFHVPLFPFPVLLLTFLFFRSGCFFRSFCFALLLDKRRVGLMKKGMELSILCDCEIAIIIMEGDSLYQYSSSSMETVLQHYYAYQVCSVSLSASHFLYCFHYLWMQGEYEALSNVDVRQLIYCVLREFARRCFACLCLSILGCTVSLS